jgi:hypothetical protein
MPYTVTGSAFRGILVRTEREPMTMMNAVEKEIWATDRNVALTLTGTLEGYISQFSFAGPRFGFFLMTIFGAIGLALVTIGVYSVLASTACWRIPQRGARTRLEFAWRWERKVRTWWEWSFEWGLGSWELASHLD